MHEPPRFTGFSHFLTHARTHTHTHTHPPPTYAHYIHSYNALADCGPFLLQMREDKNEVLYYPTLNYFTFSQIGCTSSPSLLISLRRVAALSSAVTNYFGL